MCRAPAAWAWWPAVGAPLERRVRAHWWGAAVDLEFHTLDSGGAAARGQEQSRYSASAETAVALHGASRLASSSSRSGRGEGVCPLVGTSATMTTTQRLPPRAASSCIWTGRLQAGPEQNPTLLWPAAVNSTRRCRPSPRLRGFEEHDAFGCLRRGRCSHGLRGHGALCALTFEVRRGRRQSAGPAGRMINLTWRRARWFAVGPRLDRGVRRLHWALEVLQLLEGRFDHQRWSSGAVEGSGDNGRE